MADFTPHQIANSINADLATIIKHPYVQDFMSGLDYKSRKQREKDELLINFLMGKCKMYANGWIVSNMNKTASLHENAQYIQDLADSLVPVYREMNNTVNKIILMVKDRLDADDLDELRRLEGEIQKKLK